MMFVSGETQDPSIETIVLVENIVHDQVVQGVSPPPPPSPHRGPDTQGFLLTLPALYGERASSSARIQSLL